jgi:hypothetical protein
MNLDKYPVVDSASPVGFFLLGQMRLNLEEIQRVMSVVMSEVYVDFDEVMAALSTLQQKMNEATQAASLLMNDADLDENENWGSFPSRPGAIFARHNAAIKNGAPVTPFYFPVNSLSSYLENSSSDEDMIDFVMKRWIDRHSRGMKVDPRGLPIYYDEHVAPEDPHREKENHDE